MLIVTIAGTDVTRLIIPETFFVENVLTQEPDIAEFVLTKFGSRSFAPSVDQEVIITQDGERIFAGHILTVQEKYSKLDYISYAVKCIDYTRRMDQRLVVETYENMTVAEIIAAIKDGYLDNSITINNVACDTLVKKVTFNYVYPSRVLQQLANLTDSDWYIDYNKDIHFFQKNAITAAYNLTDTNGNYVYDSLRIRRDLSQLRNSIFVRGGEFLGNTITASFIADGAERMFYLPYKMSGLQTVVTGQVKDVGVDPIDLETEHDALHNFQEKLVKFREDKKPTASSTVKFIGRPYLPVLLKMKDETSIGQFTAAEHVIIDKSITSKEAARQRALSELVSYKSTLAEGEFKTYVAGLRSGQTINIQSTLRGLDEDFVINRVRTEVFGNDISDGSTQLVFTIRLMTKRTYDHIQLLLDLLNANKKEIIIPEDEVLDLAEGVNETMVIGESVAASIVHNQISEAMSLSDTVSSELDANTTFHWGPQAKDGDKRQFLFDGSPLA